MTLVDTLVSVASGRPAATPSLAPGVSATQAIEARTRYPKLVPDGPVGRAREGNGPMTDRQDQSSDALFASLADRYRVIRELGRGGMATVFLAEDLKHRRPVAIKVM